MRFRDQATIEIEAHVAHLQATVHGLDHHERPALLDRLQLLREQVFLLNHLYMALMSTVGSAGRLLITLALLASVSPWLVLLGVVAIPTVVASATARSSAPYRRPPGPTSAAPGHLFELGTNAGPGKELRVSGVQDRTIERRRQAWRSWYEPIAHARNVSAAWYSATWALFGIGYVAAVVYVASVLEASPGDVLLVLAAGASLSRFLGVTVGEAEFLRWTLDASQRLSTWLDEYAASIAPASTRRCPAASPHGHPLRARVVHLPGLRARGAARRRPHAPGRLGGRARGRERRGKDDAREAPVPLLRAHGRARSPSTAATCARVAPEEWREALSGAPRTSSGSSTTRSARSAWATSTSSTTGPPWVSPSIAPGHTTSSSACPAARDAQLGASWADGVELSIGQWQKLALARGFMRDRPLVCVLDEPTAALDAETEHALFERFAATSRAPPATTGASPCSSRTASRRSAWPT